MDSLDKNKQFAKKLDLNYPLLSDTDKKVAAAHGILRGKWASRTTIFVGKDGKIAHIEKKVDVRNHGKQVVEQLKKLKWETESSSDNDDESEDESDDDGQQ